LHEQMQQAVLDLESKTADLRHIEADLEAVRQAHYEAGDQLNQAQGHLYEASAEVGRLEAEIRYVVEGRQRAQQRLAQLQDQIAQWGEQAQQAHMERETLMEQAEQDAEQAALLQAQLEEQTAQLPTFEEAQRAAQQKADAQRNQVVEVQQQLQVLSADQRNLQEQSQQLELRRERLQADQRGLDAPDDQRVQQAQTQLQAAQESAEVLDAQVPLLDEARREAQQRLNDESAKQADLSARLEALQALQERVKTDGKLQPWLAKHGMDGLPGLWSRLHIETGWENALESALRERLNSLEVSRLEMIGALASDPPPAKLTFYTVPTGSSNPGASALPRLSDLLRLNDAGLKTLLDSWLEGCFTAPDMSQALAKRESLQAGQWILVPQGHAVSRHSVNFYAPDSEQAGLLARAQEIENLEKQQRAQTFMHEEARNLLVRSEAAYSHASQRLVELRREASAAQAQAHELQVEALRLTQQADQARARSTQIETDLQEVQTQLDVIQERSVSADARFEELDMMLADSQERHAQLDEQVMTAQRHLQEAREQLRSLERQAQEADFLRRTHITREAELQRLIQSAGQQTTALQDEQVKLQEEFERLSDVAAQAGLQAALAVKSEREAALGAKRSQYDDLTAKLRASDEQRLKIERNLDPMRQRITDLQLKEQAARLGVEQYAQQLAEAQADLEAVARSIEAGDVRLAGLQAEIDRLQREIQALGAVNLAALDELTTARERKTFLDAQSADLTEAMNTLEDAIRKIDGETRELLGSTFATVNEHFGRMFPELFGGGHARLIMTGEEILDSGVQVMAQPPGKKNQTIHLLSGGEKALTAIALVFAIFQLNPAPFCLLDEVDAPLDDANTERYTRLVSSMSKETQFLFISHNKIAMEMAEQLIGVTMQEQGVSRIVAVDMESAVSMAEST
jgi:chromosome segregation protein